MERKVSISISMLQKKYGNKEALKIAKDIGADAVDFGMDWFDGTYDCSNPESIYAKSDEEIIAYFSELKKYADELGLEFAQTHGRGPGFKNIPEEDEILLKNARIDCLVTSVLGAPVCVIHAVTSIFMGPTPDPELMHDLNFRQFNEILKYAKQYNIKVATETFGDAVEYDACDFFGNIGEFLKTYERISGEGDNAKYFTVCADTGHSNKASRYNNNPTSANVIRMIGSEITCLHLNDNDTFTDQHKIPMTGTIDWDDVFDALDEIGYSGYYNMELHLPHFGEDFAIETAEFAIKLMRHILKTRYGANG